MKLSDWKIFVARILYVITILLIQTDVLAAENTPYQYHEETCVSAQTSIPTDQVDPDDDYTRTRTITRTFVATLPVLLTLIPNIYILPHVEDVKPKPETACITCNNSRQATLCIYLI